MRFSLLDASISLGKLLPISKHEALGILFSHLAPREDTLKELNGYEGVD